MAKASTKAQDSSASASMPLFFFNPVPVDVRRHEDAGIKKGGSFAFARSTNSVPVTVSEFPELARSMPIVFTAGDDPMPVAVLGLRQDNLFVNKEGTWHPHHYVPSYVRKYPFALLELKEKGQFALCIDEGSDHFTSEKADLPLYENGEPTEMARKALNFCGDLQQQMQLTQAFCEALKQYDLLEQKNMQAKLPDGEEIQLGGFQMIQFDKWSKLPDNVYLDWRKKGFVNMVHLALASQLNWKYLAVMAGEQKKAAVKK